MPIVLIAGAALLWVAAPVAGQDAEGPQRSGFTLLLDIGLGVQNDAFLEETNTGLAGLNLGIGGFLNENLALMFRASGTNVEIGNGVRQTSGVAGPAIQYWVSDNLNFIVGGGYGFWDIEGTSESGGGLILGIGYTVANLGKHNFQIGLDFAPAFTDPDTVYNFGILIGWQLL